MQDPFNPLTAFIGFGVSFAGKWFGGYARSSGKVCYAATSKRSLLKQFPSILPVEFKAGSYLQYEPHDMLIYCDPPYADTTSYSGTPTFDSTLFWSTMRTWSKSNTVVVSEYTAPDDFICVKEFQSRMGLTTGKQKDMNRTKRTEKLFMYKGEQH